MSSAVHHNSKSFAMFNQSNSFRIGLILLFFIQLSELVLADDKDFQNKTQNKVQLKWHFSEEAENKLFLEWKILDSDYFGNIDHYVLKWNYTKLSCNPVTGEFGEERIHVDVHNIEIEVEFYARYSIIFCVKSDKVTCENFSKPFQTEDILTKIYGKIYQSERATIRYNGIIWKNMILNIYFKKVDCKAIQGPIELFYVAVCKKDNEIGNCSTYTSAFFEYPLKNDHLVIPNLVPYYSYEIQVFLARKIKKRFTVYFPIFFTPDYEVITDTIRNLSVTSKGPDHIALRWLPPLPPKGKIDNYYVHIEHDLVRTLKNDAITVSECTQWPEYHCLFVPIFDEGLYNISIFALNPYDPSKVKLNIELEHADAKSLYRYVELDISGSKSKIKSQPIVECQSKSVTKSSGKAKVCPGDTIIYYKFSGDSVDSDVWTVEQYISADPDWAFNIYRPDVVSVQNDGLHIKPKLEEELAKNNLDLNPGCTQIPQKCRRDFTSIWNPPVVSGQLRSKKSFCFGNITIRAKLPIGDYMYPELYLEDVYNPQRRLLIAYARGNMDYVYVNGLDDGGKKLFGGPHIDVKEPGKFKYMSTYLNSEHIGASWHTFNVIWTPDKIELYLDDRQFGRYNSHAVQAADFDKANLVRVVLGIGVGGPYNFPDGYTSSNKKKPYRSFGRNAIKNFVENKFRWHNTWSEDSQLLVDFVNVTAL